MNFQRLPLETTYNTRDLGGLPVGKRVTNYHTFLRSDDLSNLSQEDVLFLKEYGIKTIIDLRSQREVTQKRSLFVSNFHYCHIPLATGDNEDVTQLAGKDFSLSQFYIDCLENSQQAINRIFTILAQTEGAALFHCAAGKDRTGVIAALVLSAVGVQKADIIANYQVTHHYLLENPVFMLQQLEYPSHLMFSNPETMLTMMTYIHHHYGTTIDYLLSIGVTEEQLVHIHEKFVSTPQPAALLSNRSLGK